MSRKPKILVTLFASALCLLPVLLLADVDGADPRLTAAPGDDSRACTACHIGTSLNGGSGSVSIVLPNGTTYTPGAKQHIQVKVSDSAQHRWGFEFSARLASSPTNGQAGDITSTDSNTQVKCSNGRAKPCSTSSPVQFITHTLSGTRLGTSSGVTFEFDWTPPSTDSGTITLYAAGNAANGNNQETGDHIYTTKVDLTPAAAATSTQPAIKANGVTNGASFQPVISPNSWITITGTNLSTVSRTWSAAELAGGALPTSLDGVSVTVNGKPAYIEYISPTQINAVSPDDNSTGPVQVIVTSNGETSSASQVTMQQVAPAFFTFDGKYLAASHASGSFLGKNGLFSAAPALTTPATAGETIVLYGTGFGPTSPAVTSGTVTANIASVTNAFTLTIGGLPATVSFAGLVPPYAEVYQLNVQVPQGVSSGDQPVVVQMNGVTSPKTADCCYITVQ